MGFAVLFFDIQTKGSDINLGGFDITVAEHFLNRPDVSPVFHQHRGKGMPERVGRDLAFYFSRFPAFADHDGDHCLGYGIAKVVHKQVTAGPVLLAEPGPDLGDVFPQELDCMPA